MKTARKPPAALLLASASPRRSALLKQLGFPFRVARVRATEVAPAHLSPAEVAMINAFRKARAAVGRYPDRIVLGADTVVSLGTVVLGKPADRKEAEQMLARLQGRTHQVITGVCLMHGRARRQKLFAVNTAVTFRRLTREQIREYLSRIEPCDKAGGYAIQEGGERIVRGIRGSFTNVVGLPVERLRDELVNW